MSFDSNISFKQFKVNQDGTITVSPYTQEKEVLTNTDGKCHLVSRDEIFNIVKELKENSDIKAINLTGIDFSGENLSFMPLVSAIKDHPAVKLLCFTKTLIRQDQLDRLLPFVESKNMTIHQL